MGKRTKRDKDKIQYVHMNTFDECIHQHPLTSNHIETSQDLQMLSLVIMYNCDTGRTHFLLLMCFILQDLFVLTDILESPNSMMIMCAPIEKLGKGSSFHHRHRWPVFQCEQDLEPGQAQPLLLLWLLHLKSRLVILPSHRWWPLLLSFHHYVGPLLLKDERGDLGEGSGQEGRSGLDWGGFSPKQGAPSSLPLPACPPPQLQPSTDLTASPKKPKSGRRSRRHRRFRSLRRPIRTLDLVGVDQSDGRRLDHRANAAPRWHGVYVGKRDDALVH